MAKCTKRVYILFDTHDIQLVVVAHRIRSSHPLQPLLVVSAVEVKVDMASEGLDLLDLERHLTDSNSSVHFEFVCSCPLDSGSEPLAP